ncbi:MAG TPA: glycosyltransferase family 4 protein [Candidatus Andersenbacteria bacterium]|nr:glycosyltransferase family 4 protein [Candidatus Andersenbacteria bacterium]
MKVAVLSTSSWRTPPRHYGPSEFFASSVTEGLHKRGIDVTLFATKDSETSAKLKAIVPKGTEEDKMYGSGDIQKDGRYWEYLHLANCFDHANEFDIIHNNMSFAPLYFAPHIKPRIVTTVHSGLIDFGIQPLILDMYKQYNAHTDYVSISDSARHPDLNYIETIYHGINVSDYEFHPDAGKYLLLFGRIDHAKGAAEAIDVAKKFGMKLVLSGIAPDKDYFDKQIAPHIDGVQVEYIGSVGPEQKSKILGGAYALLHLINFEEPFGLSVIEALATGTPVIALNKGSMPEIIDSGTTGFVVDSLDEVLEKLADIPSINRADCRALVADRFTEDIMVDNYAALFEKILSNSYAK